MNDIYFFFNSDEQLLDDIKDNCNRIKLKSKSKRMKQFQNNYMREENEACEDE